MTPQQVQTAKAKLDQQLGTSPKYVGIALGFDLYPEFMKMGYLTLQPFRPVGFDGPIMHLMAYGYGRYVFMDMEIPVDEFVVGKAA